VTTALTTRTLAGAVEMARAWRRDYLAGWTQGAADFLAGRVDTGRMFGLACDPFTMGYRAARRSARGE
jgi:hypothetical protein